MKKLIILITALVFWGCEKDPTGLNGNGDVSVSIIGNWQRIYYGSSGEESLTISFNEDGNATGDWGGASIPTQTYSINDNIITFIGTDCGLEAEGNYSYTINNANTTLTLTVINDECTEYDDDREAFFSNESSATWTRVD